MLCNIFFHMAVMVVENSPPSRFLKQKHRSAKSDVLKVLFPDTGKITNPTTQMFPRVCPVNFDEFSNVKRTTLL